MKVLIYSNQTQNTVKKKQLEAKSHTSKLKVHSKIAHSTVTTMNSYFVFGRTSQSPNITRFHFVLIILKKGGQCLFKTPS